MKTLNSLPANNVCDFLRTTSFRQDSEVPLTAKRSAKPEHRDFPRLSRSDSVLGLYPLSQVTVIVKVKAATSSYTPVCLYALMPSSSMVSANKIALEDYDPEERKALLPSGSEPNISEDIEDKEDKDGWSSRRITLSALVLIILLITGTFTLLVLGGFSGRERQFAVSSIFRSNGTHEFKPTVLIVSIDGLRYVLLSGRCTKIDIPLL